MTYIKLQEALELLDKKGASTPEWQLLRKAEGGEISLYFHHPALAVFTSEPTTIDPATKAEFKRLSRLGIPVDELDGSTTHMRGYFKMRTEDIQDIIELGSIVVRCALSPKNESVRFKPERINTDQLRVLLSEIEGKAPEPTENTKPLSRQRAQENLIISTLRAKGYDPKALPKTNGRAGVRAELWQALKDSALFKSEGIFNKAWQRLRDQEDIGDAK